MPSDKNQFHDINDMKQEILSNLDNPGQLERLYRTDKSNFRRAFNALLPDVKDQRLAGFWHERLNFADDEIAWRTTDLLFVVVAAFLAGMLAKFPAFFAINEDFFYAKNIGFMVLPALAAYFIWKNKLPAIKTAGIAIAIVAGAVFINSLPNDAASDTLILSCIHLALFLWSILGFAFVGTLRRDDDKRLGFLRYNGELVVITTLIVISGGILSAVTIGLFSLIGFNIEEFYFSNVVVFGLPAAPFLGTYLTQTNPQLVGRISPVIAKIFSPLVLVMLVVYLVAMVYSGKDPYNDREFLLMFNALLIGVMAIIFFSVAETSRATQNSAGTWVLLLLSAVTIVVNGVALSAILFRISEWGITPNRAAVLGGNFLILINLLLVAIQLFKVVTNKACIADVGRVIAYYLPVYIVWTIVVTFLFPFLFGFR